MSASRSVRSLFIGLVSVGVVSFSATAQASQQFPGVLQEIADMPCVPTCLVCHTTNPGEKNTWNKPLGAVVYANGARGQNEDSLRQAFAKYAATAATDPTAAANLAALKSGDEPGSPGTSVCGAIYGCGGSARVAPQQAPIDRSAVAWALGAVAVASLLRRRRST